MKPFLNQLIRLTSIRRLLAAAFLSLAVTAAAQVPNILNYQSRIALRRVNFVGAGQFKFALADGGTTTTPTTRAAAGTAVVTSGFVTSITLRVGYTSAPSVTIRGGGGISATATTTVSGGAVTHATASKGTSRFPSCALALASDHQTETLSGMMPARLSPRISAIGQLWRQTSASSAIPTRKGIAKAVAA
jgi:hypothetical protein